MKKITFLLVFLMALTSGSYAQCNNDIPYPYDPIESTNLGFVQQIVSCNETDEYAQVDDIQIGEDYVFTSINNDDDTHKYITVTDLNNVTIAHGLSPLTVTAITSSQIRVHYTENEDCETAEGCHTTTLQILLTCQVPLDLAVSDITTTGATFAWEPQGEETAWEVIVLTSDLPAPISTTTGTLVSTNPTYVTTTLLPATEYFFYVRANCGSESSPWNKLKFTSGCDPIALFNENFETTEADVLPTCWSSIIENADNSYIGTTDYNGVNDSKSIQIGLFNADADANVILISPALSTLSSGTHRLKFMIYSSDSDPATLEVGTIDGSTIGSTFTPVGEDLTIVFGSHEHVVDFTSYTGTDSFVAIRMTSGYSVYLDEIRWEVAPLSPDVTQILVEDTTINSATFSWTPGGDETEWDVVYGLASVTDPTTLTPITPAPTGTPETTITGLQPGTKYKIWVRSVSGVNDGAWIGPIAFTTSCLPTDVVNENFDTTEYGDLPTCWSYIARGNQLTSNDKAGTYNANANSGENSVNIQRDYETTEVILVSPNLSTVALGTHRLKFYAVAYNFFGTSRLQIGSLSSSSNQAEFTMLEEIELTDTYTEYIVDFTVYEGTDTFFGIKLSEGYNAYLDDIRWELAPLCADVSNIQVAGVTTTTASFEWTPGEAETAWDIVYGETSVTNPNSLTPISPAPTGTPEGTISGLLPNTDYKVWVRSKCGTPDGDGAWIGPKTFTTACLPTAVFFEDFDTTDFNTLPDCWSTIIRGEDAPTWANIATVEYNSYSEPNSVMFDTNTSIGTDNDVILVSPNLSTLPLGSYRLKFYGYSDETVTLEIGSLDSSGNAAIFTSWEEVNVTGEYTQYVVDFTGYTGTDTFIGIRHKSGSILNLDDIRWEIAPLCPDVEEITFSETTTVSTKVSWTPGGSETNWQVVYGGIDATDPTTLTPSGVLTETNFTINGLTQNTAYNVWVRSVCGAPNGDGTWMGPFTFNTQCLATDLPYTENFESATEPNLPNCTSNLNVGTGNNWVVTESPSENFDSNTLMYQYDSENAADTWFFTRGLNLVAGTEYTISYRYGNNSSTFVEKMKVYYGNAADVDGMTEEIADYDNITNDAYFTETLTFTPATTGVYYFGFNAYSAANQYSLYVDDISVYDALSNEDFKNDTFKFYPNPVKDKLNLSYTQNITEVSVFNLLGQKVLGNTINATSTQVDMSNLASGSYLVKVTSENQTKTIKVIKQ